MLSYPQAMRKQIIITPQAKKYLDDQPEAVQDEFQARFDMLATYGRLAFPEARMIERGLFEIRVSLNGNAYRTFYCYAAGDQIWILNGFTKKTQKTPEREIDKAKAIMQRNGL